MKAKKRYPKPTVVKGPNTWICLNCNTCRGPITEDDYICQGMKHHPFDGDSPCLSEDIFDMNDMSWPCSRCRQPGVNYLDRDRECKTCWAKEEPDFIGL